MALQGVQVVCFGQYIAGPLLSMHLADQGADVLHIDPIHGPLWSSPVSNIFHRGKQCVRANLKDPKTLRQNFAPGVMKKLGLGYEALRAENPSLIYISLPGFSPQDDQFSDVKAYEDIILAACGIYKNMGLNRTLMGIEVSYSALHMASSYASVLGAFSAVACLLARDKNGGIGDYIEVPLASALLEALVHNGQDVGELPLRYQCPRVKEIQRRKKSGEKFDISYNELMQDYLDPFYAPYHTKDGKIFYVVAPCHYKHQQRLLEALGIWKEAIAMGIPSHDQYKDSSSWGCEYGGIGGYPIPEPWNSWLTRKIRQFILHCTLDEITEIFIKAKVPGIPYWTTDEWLNSSHAMQSGLCQHVADPTLGETLQMGPMAWIKDEENRCITKLRNREELQELPEPIPRVHESSGEKFSCSPWLKDVKVLDLTNVIAGPTISSTLALFGADVIKIDAVNPVYDPVITILYGLAANRGKRSVLLDIKSAEGKNVFTKLVAWADIVCYNAPEVQLEGLGLRLEDLKQYNPNIILMHFDAYGGPSSSGSLTNHISYDDNVQAAIGIASRFGGHNTPEEHAQIGTIDVTSGHCGAFACCVALYYRLKTQRSCTARTSLCAAGGILQAEFMNSYKGSETRIEESGRQTRGRNIFCRSYQCSDGYLFMQMTPYNQLTPSQISVFVQVLQNVPIFSDLEETNVFQQLCDTFGKHKIDYCVSELKRAGIAAVKLLSLEELRDAHRVEKVELQPGAPTIQFLHQKNHPFGEVTMCAHNAIRATNLPNPQFSPAPKYGEHTISVLHEFGYSEAQIQRLLEESMAGVQYSEKYCPC